MKSIDLQLRNDSATMKRMLKRRENAKSTPTQIQHQRSSENRPICLRSVTPTESVELVTGCAKEILRYY